MIMIMSLTSSRDKKKGFKDIILIYTLDHDQWHSDFQDNSLLICINSMIKTLPGLIPFLIEWFFKVKIWGLLGWVLL